MRQPFAPLDPISLFIRGGDCQLETDSKNRIYRYTAECVCVECCMFNSNYFNWSARNAKWKFVPFFVDDFSGLPFIVDELTFYFWPIGKYDTTRYYAISCDIFAMDGNGSGTPRPTCAAIGCDYFWPAFAECKNKSCILSAFNRTGNQLRMRNPLGEYNN